jgi:queuine/archaeosine tRNA-ribosyltransferase
MIQRDRGFSKLPILPVVHVPPSKNSGYQFELIPRITRLLAEKLQPKLIGIPERELGAGIVQRIETMKAIRSELDELPFYQPVHLLGTGNPWTVAIMAAAGADTFDGLEWCRTVVDHENDRLNHFQHFDLFSWQAELSSSVIVQESLKENSGVDYAGKVAFHNLDYFLQFGEELRDAVSKGRMEGFVTARLGKAAVKKLHEAMPRIFDRDL